MAPETSTPLPPSPHAPHVATFIAPAAGPELASVLAEATALLPGAEAPAWLENDLAVDLPCRFEAAALPDHRAALSAWCAGHGWFDAVLQPASDRRKRLLMADMDSTMIGQECIDELADVVGVKNRVSAITERAMRGELAFEPALRERVGLLAGLSLTTIDQVIAERLTVTPGATTLVRTMRAHGAYTCLVSGGFTLFTGPLAAFIGFDEHRANTLLAADGHLLGRVGEPILGQAAKRLALIELRDRQGLAPADTLAVGDGANDLAMIGDAGLGVAFRAKPAVAAAAAARIDHGDLASLLFVQGYRRGDFVDA